ncbi:YbfB/YjiJ family MFS transporter [Comamonadaceae bacterium G21597-S1]|nr:YbfB/YjiJ family MFS transporter [Comamonadaceae bacterium G21597-S1]
MPPQPDRPSISAWQVVLAGMVALGVAMGIGRFAFTPILPMMLADGVTDLTQASWLASANYLGYLVGAVWCTFQPWIWRRLGWHRAVDGPAMVRLGLVATALLTAGMALHLPGLWPLLRFLAGVASAVVFVYVAGWCLAQLAQRRQPEMGALIFIGPGAGIVLSGVMASAMVALQGSAAIGWLVFAVLAVGLSALVWQVLHADDRVPSATSAQPAPSGGDADAKPAHGAAEIALLAIGYGLAGLGYIVSATFLPVIARQAIPGSVWLDLFWPLFGLGIMAGALLASRIRSASDLRWRLLVCSLVQALGIGIGLWWPSSAGFALGSLLLGLPMTATTYFAMQEVRRVAPRHSVALMGLLTAVYGLGQVAGPPLTALFLAHSPSVDRGFELALMVAGGALVLGAMIFAAMTRLFPARRS